MPRTRKPRAGSVQFWPRVRHRYSIPRIRNWPISNESKPLGFAGYKAGMTHLLINDNYQHSLTKGKEIFCPATIIECPPLKTASIKFYKNTDNGTKLVSEILADLDSVDVSKKNSASERKGKEPTDFDFIRLGVLTQPRITKIGKKKPEIFEVALGGTKEQQLAYSEEKIGKEINVGEVFKEGQLIDVHSLTKGKGFQGPVRRFGIHLRQHKSEKSRRNPGSLGAWNAQGHIMWRTAHAGKMGHHLRTEYNKWVIKIGMKPDEINAKGGFVNYGILKNPYLLIKGSVGGSKKGIVRLTDSTRQSTLLEPQITYTSIEPKQGR